MSLIRNDYTLSVYSNDRWIVEIFEQHFIINKESKLLIDILSDSDNYEEAVKKFNTFFSDNLTKENFSNLVKQIFSKIPIFESDVKNAAKNQSFIKFQKPLIKAKLAATLVQPLKFLFEKKTFWILFSILSILAIFIIVKTPISSLNEASVLWTLLLYTPTVFLHELGHIAACNRFTKKNGEIGFGIYFIFPVFYSDISSIWHAKKEERIIANLAGVYLQMICMLVFGALYVLLNNVLFLQMACALAIYSFVQLIPFIRSDGYWLLSDLSSTPNLQHKSSNSVKELVKNPIKKLKKISYNELFLLIYGLFNTLVFGYFILTQIIYNWKEIFNFPYYIINTIDKIITLSFSEIYFAPNLITTVIFYLIVVRFFRNIFNKKRG